MQLEQLERVAEVAGLRRLVHLARLVPTREFGHPDGHVVLEVAVQDLVEVVDLAGNNSKGMEQAAGIADRKRRLRGRACRP